MRWLLPPGPYWINPGVVAVHELIGVLNALLSVPSAWVMKNCGIAPVAPTVQLCEPMSTENW